MSKSREWMAAWQARREKIGALADPAEKVLLLKSLQEDLNRQISKRPDVDGKIGLTALCGGVAVFFIGMATGFCPLTLAGFSLFMSSPLLLLVENILPATRRLKRAGREIGAQIDGILAEEKAENFASSPHLEQAVRAFPVLHERFADTARARSYRQQVLPEKPARQAAEAGQKTDGKPPSNGFNL